MSKFGNFKKGDKVKYVSGSHGDSFNNPLWGGEHGHQVGIVIETHTYGLPIRVQWERGLNVYEFDDLQKVDGPEGNCENIWDDLS